MENPVIATPGWGQGVLREDEARAALARGWRLTPLAGKKPILADWPNRICSEAEIMQHIQQGGNVGVLTGMASGLGVIDFDRLDSDEAIGLLERLPETVMAETGRGGRHLYYCLPARGALPNTAGKLGAKIDTRGDGGQVVLPGSIHPETGQQYRWAAGYSPDEIAIAECPDWLLAALTAPRSAPPPAPQPAMPCQPLGGAGRESAYLQSAINDESEKVRHAMEGTRNHTLNIAAMKLASLGVDDGTISAVLTEAALEAGLPAHEIGATIRSGGGAGRKSPRSIPPPTIDSGHALDWTGNPETPAEGRAYSWDEGPISLPAETPAAGPAPEAVREEPKLTWQMLPENWGTVYLPPPEHVFRDAVQLGSITLLQAHGGTGKSFLSLELAFSVALGQELIKGLPPVQAGPVAFVSFEDDLIIHHRRGQAIAKAFGFTLEQQTLIQERLRFLNPTRFQTLAGNPRDLIPGRDLRALSRALAELQPRLIIVDPVANLLGTWIDANEFTAVTAFLTLIRGEMPLCAGTIIPCHVSKRERQGSQSAIGSVAFENTARMTLPLRPLDPKELGDFGISLEKTRQYVCLEFGKTNHTPGTRAPIYMVRDEHGVLSAMDTKAMKAKAIEDRKNDLRYALFQAIERSKPDGVTYREVTAQSDKEGHGRAFRDIVAESLGVPKVAGAELVSLVKEMLAKEELYQVKQEKGKRLLLTVPSKFSAQNENQGLLSQVGEPLLKVGEPLLEGRQDEVGDPLLPGEIH